jgi:hypothetical protein
MKSSLWCVAATAALAGCTTDDGGTPAEPSIRPGEAYIYSIATPVIDADYARRRAALLGVDGAVEDRGAVYRVSGGDRLLLIIKATGGLELYDTAKLGEPGYRGPGTMTADEAVRFATDYLIEKDLMPELAHTPVAQLIDAREYDEDDNERRTVPNHYKVAFHLALDASVDEAGRVIPGPVLGADLVVLVGDGEVIGLVWHVPHLARERTAPIYSVDEATGLAVSGVEGGLALHSPRIVYAFTPWTDPGAWLAPETQFAVDDGGGHDFIRVPATPFLPWFAITGGSSATAGAAADLEVEIVGGAAPFLVEWLVASDSDDDRVIATGDHLAARLPEDAEGLICRVTDANGARATRRLPVAHALIFGGPSTHPPLSGSVTLAQASQSKKITGAGWQMQFQTAFDDGLTVSNVFANGNFEFLRMSLPSYFVSTQLETTKTRCELTKSSSGWNTPCKANLINFKCWNGDITQGGITTSCLDPANTPLPWQGNSKRTIPTNPYFMRGFDDDSLVLQSSYEVENIAPGSSCELRITQTYVFEPTSTGMNQCGIGSDAPCMRYFPIVQYWFTKPSQPSVACDDNYIAELTIQQRIDGRQSYKTFNELGAFVYDPSVVPAVSDLAVSLTEEARQMSNEGATDEVFGVHGTMDNYHQRDAMDVVHIPGCNSDVQWNCMHVHWRWAGLANAFSAPEHLYDPSLTGPPNPPKAPGSQSVKAAVVKYGGAEHDPYDAFSVVNNEDLNSGPYQSGSDLVLWVISRSSSFAGKNGCWQKNFAGNVLNLCKSGFDTASTYDQFNLNDWFLLQ